MLQKYKYAGAIGTKWMSVCDLYTGPKGGKFGRQLLPAGVAFIVSGLTIDGDGNYQVHLRQPGSLNMQISAATFDRHFIEA